MKTCVRAISRETPWKTRDSANFRNSRDSPRTQTRPRTNADPRAQHARATAQAYAGELPPDEEGGEEESEVR